MTNLPQELIETIIDHLGIAANDSRARDFPARKGLLACSLVSHSFLYRCHHYIFEEITLGLCVAEGQSEYDYRLEDKRIQRLLTLLETGSPIASHIRRIQVHVVHELVTWVNICENVAALKILANIQATERFSLVGYPWVVLEGLKSSVIRDLCRRPSITSLDFRCVIMPISYILDCPNLANLVVHHASVSYSSTLEHLPSLHSFEVYKSPSFLRHIFDTRCANALYSRLKSLTFVKGGELEADEFTDLRAVLQMASNSLQDLRICDGPRNGGSSSTLWPETINLPDFSNLRFLTIHTSQTILHQIQLFPDIRNFLRCGLPYLRHLTLRYGWWFPTSNPVDWCFDSAVGWGDLDEILKDDGLYASLRTIEISIHLVYVEGSLKSRTQVLQAHLAKTLDETLLLPILQQSSRIKTMIRIEVDDAGMLADRM